VPFQGFDLLKGAQPSGEC